MDINSTMGVIEVAMTSGWFENFKGLSMWVIELFFFVFLVQTGLMSITKVYLTAHGTADNLDSRVFGNIMGFSVFFATFIMFYLV